jgi:hypothetical protein
VLLGFVHDPYLVNASSTGSSRASQKERLPPTIISIPISSFFQFLH